MQPYEYIAIQINQNKSGTRGAPGVLVQMSNLDNFFWPISSYIYDTSKSVFASLALNLIQFSFAF